MFHSGERVLDHNISWGDEVHSNFSDWTVIQEATENIYFDCSNEFSVYGIFANEYSFDITDLDITNGNNKITVSWTLNGMRRTGIFGWYDHTISYAPSDNTMLRGLYSSWTDDLSTTEWQGDSDTITGDYYHGWFFGDSDSIQRTFWLNTFYSRYATISFQLFVGCVDESTASDNDVIQV